MAPIIRWYFTKTMTVIDSDLPAVVPDVYPYENIGWVAVYLLDRCLAKFYADEAVHREIFRKVRLNYREYDGADLIHGIGIDKPAIERLGKELCPLFRFEAIYVRCGVFDPYASPDPPETILFEDHIDHPDNGDPDFTVVQGIWDVNNLIYRARSTPEVPLPLSYCDEDRTNDEIWTVASVLLSDSITEYTGTQGGPVLRYIDLNNMYRVWVEADDQRITLRKVIAGTETILATYPTTITHTDWYTVKLWHKYSTGELKVSYGIGKDLPEADLTEIMSVTVSGADNLSHGFTALFNRAGVLGHWVSYDDIYVKIPLVAVPGVKAMYGGLYLVSPF